MKIKNLSLGLSILLAALVLAQGAMAYQSEQVVCTNCHTLSSSISISTTSPTTVTPGQIFDVSITWSGGSSVTAIKWPSVNDNAAFGLNPAVVVSSSASGTATSTLTAPSAEGSYKVTVYVSTLSGSNKITNFKDIAITVKAATTATVNVVVKSVPVLNKIKVTPSPAKIKIGRNQSFMAKTRDQFNHAISAIVTWASSNTTVGTIDSNGKFTALAPGTTVISATNGTISGNVTITVFNNTKAKNHDDENEEDDDVHEHKDKHHDKKKDSDKKHEDKIKEKKPKDKKTDKEDDESQIKSG